MKENTQSKRPLNILLVENDPVDARLCEAELKRAGMQFHFEVVETAEDFRSKVDENTYDVILADYNLPGWNDLEAFEYLRSKQLDIPFILVSGTIGDEVAVDCIKRGISDYVLKDCLPRLPTAVRRALEEKSLREEAALAQKQLVQSDRRFRALMERSADGIVLLNSRGEVVFTSHALNPMLGYSASERLGKSVFEMAHPDDAGRARSVFRDLVERPGAAATVQIRYLSKDGQWRWLECIATNLISEPSVEGVVINYRDISERKQAEEEIRRLNGDLERRVAERTEQLEAANQELKAEIKERRRAEAIVRESQERFRLLVENVKGYAIYMLDPQGRIASWNVGAERIKGYRAEEIIGRSFSCLYPLESVAAGRPMEDLRAAATTGHHEFDAWRPRKDGSLHWANVVISALRDSDGRLTGFSVLTRDITEQRRVREAVERLRRQQELILNSAGNGLCGLDQKGRCTFINPAGARLLGWKPEELAGQVLHNVLHRNSAGGYTCSGEKCLLLGSEGTHRATDDVFWREDGTCLVVDCVSTPILGDEGAVVGTVMAFQDVTERRAVERLKDQFVSMVSHELRTPLTAIRGSLGLLATGKLCLSKEGQTACQRMVAVGVANADRLTRLVNDILDLERLESGRLALAKKRWDSAQLMRAAAGLMGVMAEANGVTLTAGTFSTEVWADSDRIMQVLINLVGNAIKFSPRGGTVHLDAGLGEGEVVFEVKDNGRGIPASMLSQVFERFQQVDASDAREKGGTGLGLAISRSIVTQHGGRIWVDSVLGRGSTFMFSLPLQVAQPAGAEDHVTEAEENSDCGR